MNCVIFRFISKQFSHNNDEKDIYLPVFHWVLFINGDRQIFLYSSEQIYP